MEVRNGYKQTEAGIIPNDWWTESLANITNQIMDYRGRTPKKLGMGWGGGDIPALSAGNVKKGFVDFGAECYLGSEKLYRRWMTKGDVVKGDILFTTEAPLGNVALVPDNRKYILSQRVVLLQVNPNKALSSFLFQVMLSDGFQRILADFSSGSTAKGIQRKKFEQLRIALPPIPQQRVIARALSDVDALLDGLDRLIAKKRDLKQAAMQQLLTGQTRLPGFDGEWEVVEFGDVVSIRNLKVIASSTPAGTQCVELESLGQGSGRLLASTQARGASSKYSFQKGDVLFGRLRAYLRKYWLATFAGVCSTEIWPLFPRDERICAEFLHLLVQTNGFVNAAGVSYGTHMPRSDWAVLKKIFISLPPLAEQTAVAAVLSDMDAELTALEARRDKTRDLKQAMMQELLTGRTRLVPAEDTHA
jgi:type I restriction enzyme S subunit